MKKLICFDLDGTLTENRTKIDETNVAVLEKLARKYKLLMVSAGTAERVYEQLNRFPIDILGNYGMEESKMINGKFTLIRRDNVTVDRDYFIKAATWLREKYGYTQFTGDSVEFHPSGMVTIPLLGTKADLKDKLAFDPNGEKRSAMRDDVIELFKDYVVFISGSNSFDFSQKKYNKYNAVMTYARENGYVAEEILFVGNEFKEFGGDYHIRKGGLDFVNITDYRKLGEFLAFLA